MDPFIESQRWRDFHTNFIVVVSEILITHVRPKYVVEIGEYVYLATEPRRAASHVRQNVSIVDRERGEFPNNQDGSGAALAVEPMVLTLPLPEWIRQPYLTIRSRQSLDVVTVIELLSPWNKTAGAGQQEYLNKRQNVFATPAHLVEIDLLRGGQRLPTVEPLQPGDYYAFVCRTERLPKVDVHAWPLRHPLPPIPVPLAEVDPDVTLELQIALDTTYDRAGYDYSLHYDREMLPPLSEPDEAWIRETLNSK
jgi:hypothetical protein